MPKKKKKTTEALEGRYVLTVFGWNGPGNGKQVRGFDTRAELLDHLADVVTGGKGERVGEEEIYMLTILDRKRTRNRGKAPSG